MKWTKRTAGIYISEDEMFEIRSSWDRSYGNHWVLVDKKERTELENNPETSLIAFEKSRHHFNSFKECKGAAERRISK